MPGLMKKQWLLGAAVKHTYRQLGYIVSDILSEMIRDDTMKRIFSDHGVAFSPPSEGLVEATAQ
tara:strand:+ start:905 stop:1096 length:192 start_codon:yes stop_codon:yes gene_type:complete